MGKDTSQQLTIYKTMQEQLQTLTLEEAFAHELAKDVKLKGGGTAIVCCEQLERRAHPKQLTSSPTASHG